MCVLRPSMGSKCRNEVSRVVARRTQLLSSWPNDVRMAWNLWWSPLWYFETSRVFSVGKQGFQHRYYKKSLFCRKKSEVGPSDAGTARILAWTFLKTIIKGFELSKWLWEDLMPEVVTAQMVARRVTDHEMMLKLLGSDLKALKITLVWLDLTSCNFFDVEMCTRAMCPLEVKRRVP